MTKEQIISAATTGAALLLKSIEYANNDDLATAEEYLAKGRAVYAEGREDWDASAPEET